MVLIHKHDRYVLVITSESCEKLYQETKSFFLQHGKCDECGVPLKDFSPCQCKGETDTLCIAISEELGDTVNLLFNKERKRENAEKSAWSRAFNRQYCAGVHTKKDLVDILTIQGGSCYFCNTDLAGKKTHGDHLTPVSRDGDDWPTNMAVTCIPCNQAKSNSTEREFWGELKEKLGETLVSELRAKRREQKKEKDKITRLRRSEIKENIKTFKNRLEEAFGPKADIFLEIAYEDDGITIEIDGLTIATLPHSHRFVDSWAKKDLAEMAATIKNLVRLMSAP